MPENWEVGRHPDPCLGWQERAFAAEAALAAAGVRIADLEAGRDEAEERSRAWEHAAQTQADALAAAAARLDLCLRALRAVDGAIDFLPRTEEDERREDEALALVRAALGDAGGGTREDAGG